MKEIRSIKSDEEMWEGAVLSTKNASDLFESAVYIFDQGKLGCASSLMVLSTEESAKAISIGFSISPSHNNFPISKIFMSHKQKHNHAAHVSSVIHMIIGLLREPEEGKPLHGVCGILAEIEEWRKEANRIKQKGFYVDNQNDKWISPSQIDVDVYKKTKFQAETLLSIAEGFFIKGSLNEIQSYKS
ncbi:MAG: AbiV family abortive infection protein [Candidatus Thiodiazotropha endolucinida]